MEETQQIAELKKASRRQDMLIGELKDFVVSLFFQATSVLTTVEEITRKLDQMSPQVRKTTRIHNSHHYSFSSWSKLPSSSHLTFYSSLPCSNPSSSPSVHDSMLSPSPPIDSFLFPTLMNNQIPPHSTIQPVSINSLVSLSPLDLSALTSLLPLSSLTCLSCSEGNNNIEECGEEKLMEKCSGVTPPFLLLHERLRDFNLLKLPQHISRFFQNYFNPLSACILFESVLHKAHQGSAIAHNKIEDISWNKKQKVVEVPPKPPPLRASQFMPSSYLDSQEYSEFAWSKVLYERVIYIDCCGPYVFDPTLFGKMSFEGTSQIHHLVVLEIILLQDKLYLQLHEEIGNYQNFSARLISTYFSFQGVHGIHPLEATKNFMELSGNNTLLKELHWIVDEAVRVRKVNASNFIYGHSIFNPHHYAKLLVVRGYFPIKMDMDKPQVYRWIHSTGLLWSTDRQQGAAYVPIEEIVINVCHKMRTSCHLVWTTHESHFRLSNEAAHGTQQICGKWNKILETPNILLTRLLWITSSQVGLADTIIKQGENAKLCILMIPLRNYTSRAFNYLSYATLNALSNINQKHVVRQIWQIAWERFRKFPPESMIYDLTIVQNSMGKRFLVVRTHEQLLTVHMVNVTISRGAATMQDFTFFLLNRVTSGNEIGYRYCTSGWSTISSALHCELWTSFTVSIPTVTTIVSIIRMRQLLQPGSLQLGSFLLDSWPISVSQAQPWGQGLCNGGGMIRDAASTDFLPQQMLLDHHQQNARQLENIISIDITTSWSSINKMGPDVIASILYLICC